MRFVSVGALQLSRRAGCGAQQRRTLTEPASSLDTMSDANEPLIRWLGRVDYEPTWRAMQSFTERRDADTQDEIWMLEHPPVFTQGMNGKAEHVLAAGD